MKRTLIFFVAILVSMATWARTAPLFASNFWSSIGMLIVVFLVFVLFFKFVFIQFSKCRSETKQIIEMPEILKRIIAIIQLYKKEYFEIIIKKQDYPTWIIDKIDTISNQLDKDNFFDDVELLIFKAQSESAFETQKGLHKNLLNAESRIRNVMNQIREIFIQNCMYEIEAPRAIESVADHLKELQRQRVDISSYKLRLQKLSELLENDLKTSKEVFDGCKQILQELHSHE